MDVADPSEARGVVTRVAVRDDSLQARVTRCRPLHYDAGADHGEDRPGHVRAASGAAWIGDRLVLVQDDAQFLALVDPDTAGTRAIHLPRGHEGRRVFDERRGTKQWKLDLESCVVVGDPESPTFLAFGSGSTPQRRRVAVGAARDLPGVRITNAASLYQSLESRVDFAGSELNIEGAAALPNGRIRLFQRGNGARSESRLPINATGDLVVDELLAYLAAGDRRDVAPPRLHDVAQWELGTLGAARLTFTDATWWSGQLLFIAAAEDSPDTYHDGPVVGAVVGVMSSDGTRARWAQLTTGAGAPWIAKPEGIVAGRTPGTVILVVDRDDPDAPAELCDVELGGAWHE